MFNEIDPICQAIADIATAMAPIVIGGVSYSMQGFAIQPPKMDTATVPALYPLTGPATNDWVSGGSDSDVETRQFQLHVPVLAKGLGVPGEPEQRCRPIIAAVRDTFASYPSLNGCDGVKQATVMGDSGVILLPDYEGTWMGFITRLQVSLFLRRTFAAGE